MSEPITVEEWGHEGGRDVSVGGMGGFVNGHSFDEYEEEFPEGCHVYLRAIRDAVVKGRMRHGGDWHQNGGAPIFSDGTVGSFTFRAWGDLLAAIWNTEENAAKYGYMDFYL